MPESRPLVAKGRQVQGHTARKRFGQHFLTDPSVLQAIADVLALKPADRVVEIGPGLGALTQVLIERLDLLTAIELDRDLAQRLIRAYEGDARLDVIQADALKFDWSQLLGQLSEQSAEQSSQESGARIRLVGNLPYNISSPLLVMLCAHYQQVSDQHFMLQKEVVQRITATQGADYGRLGILLQAFYTCQSVLDVSPEAFSPPPRVQSAVVRMRSRMQPLVKDANMLSELLRIAFGQRRKMMRGTLMPWLAQRGWQPQDGPELDPQARPQQVPAQSWYALSDCLTALADDGPDPGRA